MAIPDDTQEKQCSLCGYPLSGCVCTAEVLRLAPGEDGVTHEQETGRQITAPRPGLHDERGGPAKEHITIKVGNGVLDGLHRLNGVRFGFHKGEVQVGFEPTPRMEIFAIDPGTKVSMVHGVRESVSQGISAVCCA